MKKSSIISKILLTIVLLFSFVVVSKADIFIAYPEVTVTNAGTINGFSYSGYSIYYGLSGTNWGIPVDAADNMAVAQDGTYSTNTLIQFMGRYGDSGTNFGQVIISLGAPTYSPAYRFIVFFPSGMQVPPNGMYPLNLFGFIDE